MKLAAQLPGEDVPSSGLGRRLPTGGTPGPGLSHETDLIGDGCQAGLFVVEVDHDRVFPGEPRRRRALVGLACAFDDQNGKCRKYSAARGAAWRSSRVSTQPHPTRNSPFCDHELAVLRPHRDPFDRLLAAQSMVEGTPLVTNDPILRTLPGLQTRW